MTKALQAVCLALVLAMCVPVSAGATSRTEGITCGASGELAHEQAPSTYGASGRAQAPSTKVSPPLAFSRSL